VPIFEYRCRSCAHDFELLVRGAVTVVCPSCGSTSVERTISTFGVSSSETLQRSRKKLGAADRRKAEAVQKEQSFYKTDHHDD
jgi:putative FmdB family regulatory protein